MMPSFDSLTGGGALTNQTSSSATASGSADAAINAGFNAGSINFGSNNGVPVWALLVAAGAAWYLLQKKK